MLKNEKEMKWIKGEKKAALLTFRQKPGQYINYQNHLLIAGIEDRHYGPVMQCTTPPSYSNFSLKKFVLLVTEITFIYY